jgi:hypothetical protein
MASTTTTSLPFAHFISTRCRSYVVHEAAQGTLVDGRAEYGCNVYASGEHQYVECIMARAGGEMLAWLARLSAGEEGGEERWEVPVSMSEAGVEMEKERDGGDGEGDGDEDGKEELDEGEDKGERVADGWAAGAGA